MALRFEDPFNKETRYFVGLDLGQANDYTALSIVRQTWNNRYEYSLRYLTRTRGEPYPEIVRKVSKIMGSEKIFGTEPPVLIIDKTGVGAPIADMFRVGAIRPTEITITGGIKYSAVPRGFHVPRTDLMFSLLAVAQQGRFKADRGLELADELEEELRNLKVKISKEGKEGVDSWRESVHDDLVFSISMATWYGEHKYGKRAR
jgi:hypothetical protein